MARPRPVPPSARGSAPCRRGRSARRSAPGRRSGIPIPVVGDAPACTQWASEPMRTPTSARPPRSLYYGTALSSRLEQHLLQRPAGRPRARSGLDAFTSSASQAQGLAKARRFRSSRSSATRPRRRHRTSSTVCTGILAPLDARELQQVLDQGAKALRVPEDDFEVVAVLLGGRLAAEQRVGEALDRGEWSPKLVRGAGEEVASDLLELPHLGDVVEDCHRAGPRAIGRKGHRLQEQAAFVGAHRVEFTDHRILADHGLRDGGLDLGVANDLEGPAPLERPPRREQLAQPGIGEEYASLQVEYQDALDHRAQHRLELLLLGRRLVEARSRSCSAMRLIGAGDHPELASPGVPAQASLELALRRWR